MPCLQNSVQVPPWSISPMLKSHFFTCKYWSLGSYRARAVAGCFDERPDLCFRFWFTTAAGSTNGPDQVGTAPFSYVNTVLKEDGSGGSYSGSIWFEVSKGTPTAPSWCGGGNFSLLLFAFAWVMNLLFCNQKEKDKHKSVILQSLFYGSMGFLLDHGWGPIVKSTWM